MRNLILFIAIFIFSSCFQEKEDFLFKGLFVEFDAVSLAPEPENFQILLEDGQGRVTAQVNLVGPHQDTDQTIGYHLASASTAEEGKHCDLNGQTFMIPAHSSFGYIEFDVMEAAIPAGESVVLTLVLEGNERIPPSENYKQQTYVIRGK